jgi:sugar phosphate isomerase/epimerase
MKFAICNEIYEGWNFADVCRSVAKIGYTGVEIAPFTLAPMAGDISSDRRKECRKQAADAGIEILGAHWLLAKTTGFQINAADPAVRKRTATYLSELVHLTADLGGSLMVFGSPNARQVPQGMAYDDAMNYAADTFRQMTPALKERGVRLCLEPLSPKETNFLLSAAEGATLMRMIDHPNVVLHLDVKAMASEQIPIPQIIRQHARYLGHFHANDANLRGPGMGEIDFVPIFAALREVGYDRWVSVEVFDFKPDPETIARESLGYMKRCLEAA